MRFKRLAWVFVFALAGLFLFYTYLRKPSTTPVLRGMQLAEKQGCFACHGPGGTTGSPNLGGETDVPAWIGETSMMYLKSDATIREYLVEGHPYGKKPPTGLIRMPAYGRHLSAQEISDLIAYVKAVAAFYPNMPDSVLKGFRAAQELGCFACHGPSGRGGIRNPGSFKGLIAGWDDPQISDLARNDAEFEEWIQTGTLKRLGNHPIAGFFLRRQRVKMPAYAKSLSTEQKVDLIRYIRWVSSQD